MKFFRKNAYTFVSSPVEVVNMIPIACVCGMICSVGVSLWWSAMGICTEYEGLCSVLPLVTTSLALLCVMLMVTEERRDAGALISSP